MIHFHHTALDAATILDMIAKGAAIVIGVFAVITWRESNKQRQADLRWKQAEQGKQLWDEIVKHPRCLAALRMIELSPRTYEIERVPQEITHARAMEALTLGATTDPTLTGNEVDRFVWDAFDPLFFHFNRFERHLRGGLLRFEDVETPTEYYVEEMVNDKSIYTAYLQRIKYEMVLALLNRFDAWRKG